MESSVLSAQPMLSHELQQQGPIPSTSSTAENPASKTSQSITSPRLKGSPDGISVCSGAAVVFPPSKGDAVAEQCLFCGLAPRTGSSKCS